MHRDSWRRHWQCPATHVLHLRGSACIGLASPVVDPIHLEILPSTKSLCQPGSPMVSGQKVLLHSPLVKDVTCPLSITLLHTAIIWLEVRQCCPSINEQRSKWLVDRGLHYSMYWGISQSIRRIPEFLSTNQSSGAGYWTLLKWYLALGPWLWYSFTGVKCRYVIIRYIFVASWSSEFHFVRCFYSLLTKRLKPQWRNLGSYRRSLLLSNGQDIIRVLDTLTPVLTGLVRLVGCESWWAAKRHSLSLSRSSCNQPLHSFGKLFVFNLSQLSTSQILKLEFVRDS